MDHVKPHGSHAFQIWGLTLILTCFLERELLWSLSKNIDAFIEVYHILLLVAMHIYRAPWFQVTALVSVHFANEMA